MNKHVMLWKTFKAKSVRGTDYQSQFPDLIAKSSKGLLLTKILAMPKKNPIDFETAARNTQEIYFKLLKDHRIGYKPGECFWYLEHFTEWISEQGFHIEL